MMKTHLFNSIGYLKNNDLLAFNNCLFSKEFFKFVEKTHKDMVIPFYFSGYENEKLTSFSPGYIQNRKIPITFDLDLYLHEDAHLRELIPIEKVLLMHTPFRLRSEIFAKDDKDKSKLLSFIDDTAYKEDCDAIVFPFVFEKDESLHKALNQFGYVRSFNELDFYLNIQFESFDSFLSSLNGKVRKQYLNDRNRFAKHNIRIQETTDILSYKSAFHEMHKQLMKKYGHNSLEFDENSFEEFCQTIKNSVCNIAIKNDELVGYSLSIFDTKTFHCLRCYQKNETENARAYFMLLFETSIKRAIEHNCKYVDFGKAGHQAKLLRGCSYNKGFVYIKLLNPKLQEVVKKRIEVLSTIKFKKYITKKKPCNSFK